jgi:hypothetical protein
MPPSAPREDRFVSGERMQAALFTITIFVSATLLFLVQPLFARMVLPLLGGSPAVWNTALVFYQAALLGGYGYAHLTTQWLGARRQAGLHLALLALPLLTLPLAVPAGWTPPTETNPIPALLGMMAVTVGPSFFVVSATSPVLQKWFAATGHRQASDPYFLYAASNVGSLFSLLAYPTLLEPRLRLMDQSRLWAGGYGLLVLLLLLCAVSLWRSPRMTDTPSETPAGPGETEDRAASVAIAPARRWRWILLAFIPSSLMMSVTTYLSTDVAAVPLLWVAPLALYLLTFIFVFAAKPPLPHTLMVRALPLAVVPLVLVLAMRATQPLLVLIALHLTAFFIVCMVCHGEMAKDRPPVRHLTGFYLLMSLGGVLGGAFNALLAPVVFSTVLEYPLTLVLACLVAPLGQRDSAPRAGRLLDFALPLALGLLTALLSQSASFLSLTGQGALALIFGPPVLLVYFASRRPTRFGLGIAAILLAGLFQHQEQGRLLYRERSFFGVNRVADDPTGMYRQIYHGHVLHGLQSLDPARRREPLTYYYPTGPVGQLFQSATSGENTRVAVVGLGAGSLASYGKPGQMWDFYEIDPAVARIAQNPRWFTFLSDSPAAVRVILGDARLTLARSGARYDRLILDAYSSDAIPVHLMTREALTLYLERLAPRGILAFHISNAHLDMEPVLAELAADRGLVCRVNDDTDVSADEARRGKSPSKWAVLARTPEDLGPLAVSPRWLPARRQPHARVWTDSFSSILTIFRWD